MLGATNLEDADNGGALDLLALWHNLDPKRYRAALATALQ
jgi:hypothetical protein